MLQARLLAHRSVTQCLAIGRQLPRQTPFTKTALGITRTLMFSASASTAKGFYAVRKGRQTGVYDNWEDAKAQVEGFSGGSYRKCTSREAADAFVAPLGEVSSPEKLVVYTDGSYHSDGRGGFGAYFAADAIHDMCERVPSFKTEDERVELGCSIQTEFYAVLRVLEEDPDPSREIHFHCDCSHVVDAFNRSNDAPPSRRKRIKHRDMILYIQKIIDNRAKAVKFSLVKGHAGIPGNIEAHKLARKAAALPDIPSRNLKADFETYQAKLVKTEEAVCESTSTKGQKKGNHRGKKDLGERGRLTDDVASGCLTWALLLFFE